MHGISTASGGISYAVQGAGLLAGLVRGIVRDLIAQFVATLAARLPQWLAEVGLTLRRLLPKVTSLGEILTGLKDELAKLLRSAPGGAKPGGEGGHIHHCRACGIRACRPIPASSSTDGEAASDDR